MSQIPATLIMSEQKTLLAESLFTSPNGHSIGTGLPIVAVASLDILMARDAGLQGEGLIRANLMPKALIVPLEGTSSFVQIWDDHRTLWVATENDSYRDDYRKFAEKYFGVKSLSGSLHADHVYNRRRGKNQGLDYIRMMALPAFVNESHGGGWERAVTTNEKNRKHVPVKAMDDFMWMKALRIPSPRKGQPLSPEQQNYLRGIAKALGLPTQVLLDGLINRFNRVHGTT